MPDLPRLVRWITHPADRINVAMASAVPPLLFVPFFVAVPGLYVVAYGIVLFLFFGKSNYLLHLHIHRPFCLVELALGAVTAMVSSNWRIQHLYGHHRGIDLPYRGDRSWQLEKYSPARALSYSVGSIMGTFCGLYREPFRKGILANVTTPMNYRWAFVEHTLLNNSLDAEFNSSTYNFGYHTAHHICPGAHWTELPEIYRKIADKIPQNCLKPVSWSGLLLPYHFYLSRLGRM